MCSKHLRSLRKKMTKSTQFKSNYTLNEEIVEYEPDDNNMNMICMGMGMLRSVTKLATKRLKRIAFQRICQVEIEQINKTQI